MTTENILPLITFMISISFSPGPNNITSASLGMNYGFTKALSFIAGVYFVIVSILLVCGNLTGELINRIPGILIFFKIAGGIYLLWLAFILLKNTNKSFSQNAKPLSFKNGFLLQIINPKALLFGVTIFTVFLNGEKYSLPGLVGISLLLPLVSLTAVSTWAALGSFIFKSLKNQKIQISFNIMLAGLLIYSAINILI